MEDIPYCPVFKPSIEEFEKGFVHYLNKVEPSVGNAGIFKVVAPPEWVPRELGGSYRDFIDSKKFNVNKPIEQNVYGTKGVFEIVNFV